MKQAFILAFACIVSAQIATADETAQEPTLYTLAAATGITLDIHTMNFQDFTLSEAKPMNQFEKTTVWEDLEKGIPSHFVKGLAIAGALSEGKIVFSHKF